MSYPWLESVEAEFTERLGNGRLPHALLLAGPRDTGKTELAAGFIASLMCQENCYPACGSCRSCMLLESGAHPDRYFLTFEEHPRTGEPRKELVVDQVRRLIASLHLTNTFSHRKAALIVPAEAMNISTANAVLKTLEEPPGDSVLLLVSHDPVRLPATIRSRCQNLNVRLPDPVVAMDWLLAQGGDREEAAAALKAAAGSPLRALRMMKDGSTEQYRLVLSTLRELRSGVTHPGSALAALGEIDPDLLWSWISLLAAGELKQAATTGGGNSKALARLQLEADNAHRLVPTPVRKDFLLQDWLIQWSRLEA